MRQLPNFNKFQLRGISHANRSYTNRYCWNLSIGQVNDAFTNLGMAIPGNANSYTQDSQYNGSQGQNALMQSLNPQAYQQYQAKQQQQNLLNQQQQQQTAFNNLLNTDNQSITDFLGKYSGDVTNAQNTAYSQYGIPTQVNNVDALTSRINDLENNGSNSGGGAESGTGMGGYASESQVGNELNSRELPNFNTAVSNLNTSLGAANTYIGQELAPDQAYESLLSTNIQTSMQGLTANESAQLQASLGALEAGYGLTETQMTNAENLASTVLTNANNITTTQIKNSATVLPQNQAIVNPYTGAYTLNTGTSLKASPGTVGTTINGIPSTSNFGNPSDVYGIISSILGY